MNIHYYGQYPEFLYGMFRGFNGFSGLILAVVSYILLGLGLSSLARRRGIHRPWMAWVPVLRLWLLGCVSDQYQYVVHGKNKSKRKALVILSGVEIFLSVVTVFLGLRAFFGGYHFITHGHPMLYGDVVAPLLGLVFIGLLLAGVAIAKEILKYMALYDLYSSCCPANNVLFLLLSIFFRATTAFFIFFNREKDEGMPPRREPTE